MNKKKILTDREKAALYGLVRFPKEAAVRIAKELSMPQPTFSNIQRRLRKNKYYKAIGIPDLRALGLDMLSVIYGTYNPLSTHKGRKKLESDLTSKYPEIFYKVAGLHNVILFLVSTDIVEMNKIIHNIQAEYLEQEIIEKDGLNRVDFTLPTTLMARFFDYSKTLYVKFELEGKIKTKPPEVQPLHKKNGPNIKLNPSESKVLLYMLEDPDASDMTIAKKLKLSRTTVSRARNKLLTNGIMKKVIIPDLGKIGFEVFAFSDTKFNPETSLQQRIKSTKWLMAELPIFLSIVTDKEAVTLYSFLSYHGFQTMKRHALIEYKDKGYIKGDINILLFSTPEIEDHRPPDFVPIVKKILGI